MPLHQSLACATLLHDQSDMRPTEPDRYTYAKNDGTEDGILTDRATGTFARRAAARDRTDVVHKS